MAGAASQRSSEQSRSMKEASMAKYYSNIAIAPDGSKLHRTDRRKFKFAILGKLSFEHAMNATLDPYWAETDRKNFDYYSKFDQSRIEGLSLDAYLAQQQQRRVQAIEDRKAKGEYDRWHWVNFFKTKTEAEERMRWLTETKNPRYFEPLLVEVTN
jgi:hypothetical protein